MSEQELWQCTICGRVGTVGRCCGKETRRPVQEVPCPDCYGGHFKPCQLCGDSGRAIRIQDQDEKMQTTLELLPLAVSQLFEYANQSEDLSFHEAVFVRRYLPALLAAVRERDGHAAERANQRVTELRLHQGMAQLQKHIAELDGLLNQVDHSRRVDADEGCYSWCIACARDAMKGGAK